MVAGYHYYKLVYTVSQKKRANFETV